MVRYLKCAYAFYDPDTLRCGFDKGGTEKFVRGLPAHKYEKKLAVDDLPGCLKEIVHGRQKIEREQANQRKLGDYWRMTTEEFMEFAIEVDLSISISRARVSSSSTGQTTSGNAPSS